MDLEAAKTQFAPQILESLAVAVGQFPFRTLLQPADRNHDEAHQDFPASNAFRASNPVCPGMRSRTCAHRGARRQGCTSPSRFHIGSMALRASLLPSGLASTIFPDCRTRAPRV